MKQTLIKASATTGLFLFAAGTSFAATLTLTNGGLGQVAAQPQQFGVAVCAGATQGLSQSVPVVVTANGKSQTVSSAASVAAGSCEYSYLSYNSFDMQAGNTYSVDVTVDPQHSVSSNANNETAYSVTVPGQAAQAAAVTAQNGNLTANISSQFSNPLVTLWNWLGDLYRSF